jgi:hypothetical protein
MRVSVAIEDNVVAVDGRGFRVDCSGLDREIHAIQWYDTYGEIEYRSRWLPKEKRWDRKPNEHFDDFFSQFSTLVQSWEQARVEDDKAVAMRKAEDEEFERIKNDTDQNNKAINTAVAQAAISAPK